MIKEKVKFYEDKEAGGLKGWWWYEDDTGAWDGPSSDWIIHKNNIDAFVQDRQTVIQLGGNLGMYPRLLSSMFETVYTFEPDPLNFYILNLNCPMENVVKTQAALGGSQRLISMKRRSMSNLGMHQAIEEEGIIPRLTLNDFRAENVDLLMIDVEGMETEVLFGVDRILNRDRPVIFLERPDEVAIEYLSSYNYRHIGTSVMDGIFIADI